VQLSIALTATGCITLGLAGRLHHIGVGRTGTRVLILDPTRDYQPTGASKGPKRKKFRT
jgi:hypothetical protein